MESPKLQKMIKNMFHLLHKNLQISLNSKASSFILVLGPIILIALVGFALQDTSLKNAKASIYFDFEDSFSDNFIKSLQSKNFQVSIEKSLNDCKEKVLKGISHVCIELNKDSLTQDYDGYKTNLYVDFSKQRVVWQIIGSIQSIVDEESNSARRSIASELKGESLTLSEQLTAEEEKLDFALNKITPINNQLNEIEMDQQESLNSLEDSRTKIASTKQTLSSMLLSDSLPNEYRIKISESIDQINYLEEDLNLLESLIRNGDIQNTKNNLETVESNLILTKKSIRNIKNSLDNINNADIDKISEPITLSYQSVLDDESKEIDKRLNSLDYIFPSFIMFFIVFGATIFGAILRIRERKSKAYIRNILSKIKGPQFIVSEIITTFILIALQTIIIFGIASYFLNLQALQNIVSTTILISLAIIIFSLIGTMLGSLLDSQESIVITTVSLSILFFIFSSIIIPVETLPQPFSSIVGLLPLTLFETKIRASLIFLLDLNFSLLEIGATILWVFIPLILTTISYIKSKRKEI